MWLGFSGLYFRVDVLTFRFWCMGFGVSIFVLGFLGFMVVRLGLSG